MVIIIPEQLKKEKFRFTRLNGKVPIDKNWQKDNNYDYKDSKLLNHKNNVGVICGRGNLFVIDIDGNGINTLKKLLELLPLTYVVKTGKQGFHMYYISDELISTTSFSYNDSHIDIKADRGQVVMSGSIHPDTKKHYLCFNNKPISKISKIELENVFNFKQNNGSTIKQTLINESINVNNDKTRSAKEYSQICSMIAKNKNKDEIYSFMSAFEKWKNSTEQYKEFTYNKALNFIENSKKEPVTDLNIRYKVLDLLCDNNKDTKFNSYLEAEELLVSFLISKYKFKTILQDEKTEVWCYNKGVYIPVGQSIAREELRKILQRGFTQTIVSKVLNKLTADTYISSKDFFKQENPFLLPVMNGLLDLKTMKLKEFDSSKVFFSKIPINYIPDSKCPNIKKHLNNVLPQESDVELLQEAIGNCLLKKYTFQKSAMLVGSGRNGKGITLQLLTHLLGVENISAITLEQLENDIFALSGLHGKLANVGGDLNKTSLKNTGTFKSATGGDLMTAPRKFLPPIEFENHAKFFYACNDLPLIYDDSRGFWDRWLYFEFPFTFVPLEEYKKINDNKDLTQEHKEKYKIADPLLKEKLLTKQELEGFLIFALDGLNNLLNNNGFSTSITFESVKRKWINQSDSFKAFAEQHLENDYLSEITKQELKQKYHEYCKHENIKTLSDKHIYNVLTMDFSAEIKLITDKTDNQCNRIRVWKGVKFK